MTAIDRVLDWIGFAVCHQLPERSLAVAGRTLPVCARDTGIYVGFLLAFALIGILERDHPRDMPPARVLVACGLFIVLMGLDGVSSYAGLRTTTNDLRLVTGTLAGAALPPIVLGMLNFQLWRRGSARRVLEPWTHQALWLATVPVGYAVMRYPVAPLAPLYPLAAIAGVLVAFTSVNLVMVTLLPPFERKAGRIRDLVLPVAIALVFTAAELAVAGGLHRLSSSLIG